MKPSEIATIALRIMGVLAIVLTFQQFQSLGIQIGSAIAAGPEMEIDLTPILIGSAVSIALCIALGVVLIVFSKPFGKALVRGIGHGDGCQQPTSEQVQAVAFSVLGVFLVAAAIPDVFRMAQQLMAILQKNPSPEQMQRRLGQIVPYLLGVCIQVALGAVLFFRAGGVVKFWHWLQKAGTTRRTEGNE